ncbi:MAG: BatA domain-containing protein [Phycisphaeraceae bacterium]|nr:BatA domain-containing protein [Phycisphaeraceae bacterium]
MSVLHPALLAAGLACVAAPIIIHFLMRRRRRPVRWAAMRFLLEAYRQQKRRLRFEQLLLLSLRCLLVALIAFALARPIAGRTGIVGPGPRTVYLVIDDSLTSAATDDGGTSALARHKSSAEAILATLDAARGDRAGLLTLGAPADAPVVPPSSDLGSIRRLVGALTPTDAPADFAGALSRIAADLGPEGQDRPLVAMLSDFRAGSVRDAERLPELPRRATLAATTAARVPVSNTALVALEPLRPVILAGAAGPESAAAPAGSTQVRADLQRFGPATATTAATTVRLLAESARGGDATLIGEAVVRWSPGQSQATASVALELERLAPVLREGTSSVVLRAEIDPDALHRDDTRRVSISLRDELRVALIGTRRGGARPTLDAFAPADWARLALEPAADRFGSPAGRVRVSEIDPRVVDSSRLAGVDAVFVLEPDAIDSAAWTRLRAFADSGGLVVVTPAARGGAQTWPDLMLEAFSLDWTVEREPRTLDAGTIAGERPATGELDLLALLVGELTHLAAPVRVSRVLAAQPARGSGHAVLALSDGTPLVLAARPEQFEAAPPSRGVIVYITSALDLDWTDLPARPLMVPLLQEIVRQGVGRAGGAWVSAAGSVPTAPPSAAELRSHEGTTIAVESGRAAQPLRRAAAWRALDSEGVTRGTILVNPDTRASRTDITAPDEIRRWLGAATPGRDLRTLDDGTTSPGGESVASLGGDDPVTPLSLPLLVAAAFVAIAELAVARFASHATVPRSAPPSEAGA